MLNTISLTQIILFLGVALTVALCATILWRTLLRPRGLPREAGCAVCRYPVRGLEAWRCPECGSDLLVVGVTTAQLELRRRGGTPTALLAWAILAILGGVTLWDYTRSWAGAEAARARAAAPLVTVSHEMQMLAPRVGGGFGGRMITVTAARTDGPAAAAEAEVTIAAEALGRGRGGQQLTLEPGGRWRWVDESGVGVGSGEALTVETLADFLAAGGAPLDAAAAEASDLLAVIEGARRPRTGPLVATTGGGSALVVRGVSSRRSTTALPVDTSFYDKLPRNVAWGCAAVWALGSAFVAWRRRRVLRSAAAGQGEPAAERTAAGEAPATA